MTDLIQQAMNVHITNLEFQTELICDLRRQRDYEHNETIDRDLSRFHDKLGAPRRDASLADITDFEVEGFNRKSTFMYCIQNSSQGPFEFPDGIVRSEWFKTLGGHRTERAYFRRGRYFCNYLEWHYKKPPTQILDFHRQMIINANVRLASRQRPYAEHDTEHEVDSFAKAVFIIYDKTRYLGTDAKNPIVTVVVTRDQDPDFEIPWKDELAHLGSRGPAEELVSRHGLFACRLPLRDAVRIVTGWHMRVMQIRQDRIDEPFMKQGLAPPCRDFLMEDRLVVRTTLDGIARYGLARTPVAMHTLKKIIVRRLCPEYAGPKPPGPREHWLVRASQWTEYEPGVSCLIGQVYERFDFSSPAVHSHPEGGVMVPYLNAAQVKVQLAREILRVCRLQYEELWVVYRYQKTIPAPSDLLELYTYTGGADQLAMLLRSALHR